MEIDLPARERARAEIHRGEEYGIASHTVNDPTNDRPYTIRPHDLHRLVGGVRPLMALRMPYDDARVGKTRRGHSVT